MPTYEYACTSCGERTEKKQGFNDPPLEECPLCRGKLRKLYSPVGIVFKGSGFYSTDARKKAASASSGDGKAPKKESSGKDSAGKEPATGGRSKSGADKSE